MRFSKAFVYLTTRRQVYKRRINRLAHDILVSRRTLNLQSLQSARHQLKADHLRQSLRLLHSVQRFPAKPEMLIPT